MTNQEAFDKSVAHVLSQEERCERAGYCAYAGEREGQACGVGVLLKRETGQKLDETFNEYNWTAIVNTSKRTNEDSGRRAVAQAAVDELEGVDPSLLERLQVVHDSHASRGLGSKWRMYDAYVSLASRFGLKMSHPKPDEPRPSDDGY
jgi:hypothetical protein